MTELRYEYVPPYPGDQVDHVGTYKRTLPVSLERMYENALDWEHLPHLHASSFTNLECVDAGSWGWRAKAISANGQESLLELSLDRSCRRWITRNIEGPSVGAQIWTHVFVTGERSMDLVIDFFVPGVPEDARAKVGLAYARAYETLYDEDVWMMTERQNQIDLRVDGVDESVELKITTPDENELPVQIQMSGRDFMLNRLHGRWVAYPAACPHQLGPLTGDINSAGDVTCPWHGYTFNVTSGDCTSGAQCRFGRVPAIEETGERLRIHW